MLKVCTEASQSKDARWIKSVDKYFCEKCEPLLSRGTLLQEGSRSQQTKVQTLLRRPRRVCCTICRAVFVSRKTPRCGKMLNLQLGHCHRGVVHTSEDLSRR